jgi:oligoendopeptidase F
MTSSAPFTAAMAEMNATMDEIEHILARAPKKPGPKLAPKPGTKPGPKP